MSSSTSDAAGERDNEDGVELTNINVLPVDKTELTINDPTQKEEETVASPVNEYDNGDDEDGDVETWFVFDHTTILVFYRRHNYYIKAAILAVLAVLYFVYFGFALNYRFGDEGSIRLLWITCLVVFILLLKLIVRFLRPQLEQLSSSQPISFIRQHHRHINWAVLVVLYVFLIIFVIVDITVVTKNYYNFVSLSGIIVYVGLMLLFSIAPTKVNWQTVLWGICLQFIFALIVLRWYAGYVAFKWLADRFTELVTYSDFGAKFVFGDSYRDHFVAFQVLPVIVFLSSVVSILFYWGVMQYIIRKMAWVMQFTMGTTAAESFNAAANIFLGSADAPLAIRPMLPHLTRSEIHAVMTGGYATIAGSVLAAYIAFGVPGNHLLSASFMSAPAALAVSKLFYPETKKSHTTVKEVKQLPKGSEVNFIEAAAVGAANAIALVANIAANLIAFFALLHFINATLTWFGDRVGIQKLTYELICSYLLYPLALVMGVNVLDCRKVAELIGIKTFINEFVGYLYLSELIRNRHALESHVANNGTWHWLDGNVILTTPGLNDTVLTNGVITERSELISTYVMCGFGSFGAIGIQIGALVAMAPSRRKDFARIALRSMIAGNVACFMTACIAGLFFQEV